MKKLIQALGTKGFTLIELMIAVAIIGVLSAVAIPVYLGYLRRSYLSEATSSISSIKSAEESYFSVNGCYIAAPAWPATVPSGNAVLWDPVTVIQWQQSGLSVRPDRRVRFSYQVYATNSMTVSEACAAVPADGVLNDRTSGVGGATCIQNFSTNLVPASIFPANWYVIVAQGDLNGDGVASNIISAIDDSTIINCNELE